MGSQSPLPTRDSVAELSYQDIDAYCPKASAAEDDELRELVTRIDTDTLTAHASSLRNGIPCTTPTLLHSGKERNRVMGGMNYHLEVTFEDGVTWLARIRRSNASSPPAALRDYIIESEVATLRFLEGTGVPAPRVFGYALEHLAIGSGVGYILMEKLPGEPLALRWGSASAVEKRRVMEQLADVFDEMHKHPFEELGSLAVPGLAHVGGIAQEVTTDFTGPEMHLAGPFSSVEDYHKHSTRLILDLILREEMYTDRPVSAYLIHLFLLDILPSVLPPPSPAPPVQRLYLKHADDKGDHILIDRDFNITGIIDWEWAHTAPPSLAFNSPIGVLPVADFYDGKNEIGEDEAVFAGLLEEKGRGDIAAHVRAGRLQHRFAFCCGYDLRDWGGFVGLFRGLRDCVGVDGGIGWEEWRAVALERYTEDAGLRQLLDRA